MFITMVGSSFSTQEYAPIDNLIYNFCFEIDHATIESGMYVYGASNAVARRLGGQEIGLTDFYELKLRLKLKRGEFKTLAIDLNQAMHTFLADQPTLLAQFQNGELGGDVVVKVSAQSVNVSYRVYQHFSGAQNQRYFKSQTYPVCQVEAD